MITESTVRTYPFSVPHKLDVDPLLEELREQEPVSRIKLPYDGEAGWSRVTRMSGSYCPTRGSAGPRRPAPVSRG